MTVRHDRPTIDGRHPTSFVWSFGGRESNWLTVMIVRNQSDGSVVMITQNDHAKLAGMFAAHWGNAQFKRPRPHASMMRAAYFGAAPEIADFTLVDAASHH